jgi:hypothetical protein
LLTVHGVGNASPRAAVEAVLKAIDGKVIVYDRLNDALVRIRVHIAGKPLDVDLAEFHWNQPHLYPLALPHGSLKRESLRELLRVLSHAARAGTLPLGDFGLFMIKALRFLIALAVVIAMIAPVELTLLHVPTMLFAADWLLSWSMVGELTEVWWSWVGPVASVSIAPALCAAAILVAWGLLTTCWQMSLQPFFIAVRALAIHLLGFPIALVGYPLSASFRSKRDSDGASHSVLGYILLILSLPLMIAWFLIRWFLGWTNLSEFSMWLLPTALMFLPWVIVALLTIFTIRAIAPAFKILLDIFRYIGDPAYREALQNAFSDTLERLRGQIEGRTFVLLAHSLGSVIAADSLAMSRGWHRGDRVWLITMGSPLRRFFLRHFPRVFFPDSIAGLKVAAAASVSRFEWINVYRPFDYVGASLGLSRSRTGCDRCTNQWRRFHADYWSDSTVANCVFEELARLNLSTPDAPREHPRPKPNRDGLATTPHPTDAAAPREALAAAWVLTGLMAVVTIIYAGISSLLGQDQQSDAIFAAAQTRGEIVEATVTHREHLSSPPQTKQGAKYHEHFLFKYMPKSGRPIEREIVLESQWPAPTGFLSKHTRYFSPSSLIKAIRPEARWWSSYAEPRSTRVSIKVLPDHPIDFILPAHPPDLFWRGILRWTITLLVSLLLSMGAFPLAIVGSRVTRFLLCD